MKYDLFYFDNSGGDLILKLLESANRSDLIGNIFLNPNTNTNWVKSTNKKIIIVVDLYTQMTISLKHKNWLFKYYNETVYFDNSLAHLCATRFSDKNQFHLFKTVDELLHSSDKTIKKKLLVEGGYLKQLIKKDTSVVYATLCARYGTKINGQEVFAGYKNSVDLNNADIVIQLETLLESHGKDLFDQLSIKYNPEYKILVDQWKGQNY
jgi:hypothetical protein